MKPNDSATGYAYWIPPDGSSKVIYSLATFAEIDAIVNEGYRRIPRGGIETGGILFGTRSGNSLQIEAIRQIDCQHAFGPSFVLSEKDRAMLHEQLEAARTDPDLTGLEPLGWFIGHTRGPLSLSDREIEWFNEFFPAPGSLTVLVKPERFQPTRFAFILRGPLGEISPASPSPAVILPLTAQVGSATPAPAIPAPKEQEPKPETPRVSAAPPQPEPPAPAPAPAEPAVPPPSPRISEVTRVRPPQPPPLAPQAPSPPPVPASSAPISAEQSNAPPPSSPRYREEPSDGTNPALKYPYATLPQRRAHRETTGFGGFGLHSIAVLVLAAVLGCLAGYWAYLQLPSPVIPVSVREQNGQLIVEWPANQTAGVDYAALQINDGPWLTLSPEQKTEGRAVIKPPSGDLKIDLVAKHWLRDSRGIVRYLRTPRPAQ